MEDLYQFILIQRQLIEKECYKLNTFPENIVIKEDNPNDLFISFANIKHILTDNQDLGNGIYGLINYNKSHNNDLLIKHIIDNNMEYHNKPSIVKKLIQNNILTEEANNDSYGFLFMYEKRDGEIIDLKKVFLLKGSDIESLNENEDTDDKIITKLYEFNAKIVLTDIIYSSVYDSYNVKNDDIEPTKKLYNMIEKYKKYVNDNVRNEDIREVLNNFSFIKTLLKKIADPTKRILNISDYLKYDFSKDLTNIKLSNRLDKTEYDNLIVKYFDDTLDVLTNNIYETSDLNKEFRKYMTILMEITLRVFVDVNLKNNTYCLSKNLTEYLNNSVMLSEPAIQSVSLKRRYWTQLLGSNDTKNIVCNLLNLLILKTKTIEETIKYLTSLF
jgi:hypothetical protein